MRLVKCRKCGATVMSDETMLEQMYAELDELNKKAQRDKKDRAVYLQQAKQLTKLITQVQHRITRIEEMRIKDKAKLWELRKYLLENGIMTEEELIKVYEKADKRAAAEIETNQKEIARVYGTYKKTYGMSNRTKVDHTADAAIRNAEKR